ncbi:hypothetical protein O0L34_g5608 [Tuta absoluta]|nr:hypothetical protein O0L34_g5608 [Tuta absoluta]
MQHELLLDRVKEQRKTDESTSTVLNSNDHSLLDIENNKIINSIKLEFRKLKNLHKSNQIINSRHIITKNLQSHESNTTRVTNTTDESITRKTDEGNCVQEVNKEENKDNSKDKAKLENTDQQQEENNGNKTNIPVKITELPMPLSKIKEKAHLEKLKVAFMEDSQHLDKMLYKCMKNTWREKETIPSITRKPAVPELDIHELSLKEPLRYENSFDKDSSALNTVFICNSHKDRVNKKKLGNEIQAELKPLAVSIQRDTHDTTKNHKASQNIMNQVSHDGQSQVSIMQFDSSNNP